MELLFDNGLQPFEVVSEIKAGEENSLHLQQKEFHLYDDFIPIAFSASDEIEKQVVFVGYGLKIEDNQFQRNDYEKMDVQDKIVLILRGVPDNLPEKYSSYTGLRSKAITAKDMGAAGVIFVSGPQFDEEDELLIFDKPEGKLSLPIIQIKRNVANELLSDKNLTVAKLEKSLNETKSFYSFPLEQSVYLKTDIQAKRKHTYNVVAQLRSKTKTVYCYWCSL